MESCDLFIPVLDQGCCIANPLLVAETSLGCSWQHNAQEWSSLCAFLPGFLAFFFFGIGHVMKDTHVVITVHHTGFVLNWYLMEQLGTEMGTSDQLLAFSMP